MARNQVAPDRPIKKNNNFVGKPEKKLKFKFNSKPLPKDESKPSCSGPGNFFVGPKDKQRRQGGVAEDLHKKNIQESTFEKATKSAKHSNKKNAGQHQNLEAVSDKSKKPFDKKKYRLQKYSKKYKLQQWEDKRKKLVLREYYRAVKDDDRPKLDIKTIYKEEDSEAEEDKIHEENENNLNTNIVEEKSEVSAESEGSHRGTSKKPKHFKKAMEEFERIKNEKQNKKQEYLKRKAEREEAIKKSKKEKALTHKKMTRSTKKGQPIMKDRLEMLLERIQKSMN